MSHSNVNKSPRYSLSIDLGGDDFTHILGRRYWLGADQLQAEGNNIEQLIQSAEIFTSDQDGGEGPQVRLNDLGPKLRDSYINAIREEMAAIDDKRFEYFPELYLTTARKADLASGSASARSHYEKDFVASLEEPEDVA